MTSGNARKAIEQVETQLCLGAHPSHLFGISVLMRMPNIMCLEAFRVCVHVCDIFLKR